MQYRRDVDGLRAVAVLPVVLFHLGASAIPGGFTGVDIFFVISGYLISGTLLDDLERGQFSIARFYWRRAKRILPALFFVVLLSVVAAYVILLPNDYRDFSRSVVATSTFWSNIYFWKTTNYFSIDAHLRPLLHTWSLAVEEQYYIFAPFLLLIVHRFLGKRWLLAIVPLIVLSFAISVVATKVAPTAGFYLLPTRVWELLLGALLMLKPPPTIRNQWLAEGVGALGLGLVALGFFILSETDPFPGVNALYPCVGAALMIYAGQTGGSADRRPTVVTRLLSLRPFVWIGLISYSLYLVHWPIAAFTRYLMLQGPTLVSGTIMLVASIALAAFSWKFIEQPFRKPRPVTAPKPIFALSATGIIALCLIGGVGVAAGGFPQRFPDFAQRPVTGGDWRNGVCFNEGPSPIEQWNAPACYRTSGYDKKVLLWGDSFAAHYVSGLEANAPLLQADILQHTFAGCPPILSYFSFARPNCTRFNARVLDIIKSEKIQTVVLAGRWTDYEARGFDGLAETVQALKGAGVTTVYVIGQSPQFATDVQKIAYFAKRRGGDTRTWPMAMKEDINARLLPFTTGATFIDPLKALCRDGRCPYTAADGSFLYFDYGHFSQTGAIEAVARYWPRFGSSPAPTASKPAPTPDT